MGWSLSHLYLLVDAVLLLSTPNGVGNWFHKTYTEAEENKNDFHTIKLPWDVHPDRDQEWFEKETRNMSRREIAQELECNFNASGETVIHGDDLKVILENSHDPIQRLVLIEIIGFGSPTSKNHILVVADVARGDGSDFSVAHVFETTTMTQVAEYQGKITPDMFAPLLYSMGSEYNNALLIVENNSLGIGVLSRLARFRV